MKKPRQPQVRVLEAVAKQPAIHPILWLGAIGLWALSLITAL